MSDFTSLTGLRGLAAMHVVIHHAFFFSKLQGLSITRNIGLFGSVELPLFFLLSGYSLALTYGQDGKGPVITWNFYRNRFARIGPLYYFCLALALPFVFVGYGLNPKGEWGVVSLWTALIDNVLCTTSWCVWWCSWSGPFCGPSWFISTLFFFYLFFPFLLPKVKCLSDLQITRLIIILFYLQLFMLYIVSFINHILVRADLHLIGDWVIVRHPFSRLPVFVMGVLAGVQQLRINNGGVDKRFIVVNVLQKWYYKSLFSTTLSNIITVQCLLTIIMGLTRDKGFSFLGKVCSSRLLQFLGGISLPLYLLHRVLMYLVCWLAYGTQSWPVNGQWNAKFHNNRTLPAWAVPVVILLSPLLAWIAHVWLEEPARKWLRSKPSAQEEKVEKNSGWWGTAPFLYLVFIILMRLSVWYIQPKILMF